MHSHEILRTHISKCLRNRKTKNENYSLRALSRDINENPSALSQIINGSRRVSRKRALKIAQSLSLKPSEIEHISQAFDDEKKIPNHTLDLNNSTIEFQRKRLEDLKFDYISEWAYFSVLSLAETSDYVGNKQWISRRLGISEAKTEKIMLALLGLGLLKEEDDELVFSGENICTSDGRISNAIKSRHEKNLDDARTALYREEISNRDFTFMTMNVDPKKLPMAKKMIRKFQNDLCEFMSEGETTEVYEICTQLFPRSRLRSKDHE